MRIHLLVNPRRGDAVEAARQTAEWLKNHGVEVAVEAEAAGFVGAEKIRPEKLAEADLVITFGGDGTVMRAAHLCSVKGTPILGVHYGRFGFVTQCKGEELGAVLASIFEDPSKTEERMMLQTDLLRGGKRIARMHSLNEIVLQRAVTARMMTFRVIIDGHAVTSYPADGVLVATPTGSTAYNLSSGGPIVDPRVKAMILNAISPHTLSARPLVIRPESEIRLMLQTEGDAMLSADSQTRLHLLSDDEVRVTQSPRVTRLVTVDPNDFLVKIRERLLWGRAGSWEQSVDC